MNYGTDHSFKRSKARKNKENLAQNRIQQENPKNQTRRTKKNASKLILRKKPRLKIKEQNLSVSGLFFKRFSMQNAVDMSTKNFKTDRSQDFENLRKRVPRKENCKENKIKTKNSKKKIQRNLNAFDRTKDEESKSTRHKGKTLSSNNFGLCRLLKNVDRKNTKQHKRTSISEKIKLQGSKLVRSGDLAKKKNAFAKHKEIKLKSKERYEQMKLSKPPMLMKPGNYTTHNPSIQRVNVSGILKRKLSINLPGNFSCKNVFSKPNSPSFKIMRDLEMKPRCFKTMNKELINSKKELDFINAPKIIKTEREPLKSCLRNQLEKENRKKSSKTENLKQILKRKKSKNNQKNEKQTNNVSNASSFNLIKTKMNLSVGDTKLKTPVMENGLSPCTPLNAFLPKQAKKTKNIFSFNKSSKLNILSERPDQNKQIMNNTSLLYSQALNQNKNQNSFIFFKNKIGSNVSGFTSPDTSNLNIKNDSFSMGLISNLNPKTRTHQSFLIPDNNSKPHKKRSKSFFEMKALDLMSTSGNFQNLSKSDQNISLLRLHQLNRSCNRGRTESESEKLTQLIESIKENEEDGLSEQIIQEEQEISSQNNEILKRPASIEGTPIIIYF